jgi:hypothetical protein
MRIGGTHSEVHIGIVTDNNDPEQRGRIRVRCDTLAGADTEWPDYIEPVFPYLSGDGQNATGGWFFVPDVGVAVEIEITTTAPRDETVAAITLDAPAIRWRACAFAQGADAISDEFKTNYPGRRGFVTGAGHGLVFDDTADDPEIKLFQTNSDGSTTFLDFDQDGSVILSTGAGHLFFMNADKGELSIIDSNANTLVMSDAGWYLTSPDSDMVKAGGGAISLMTGNVLINASGVSANVGEFLIAQSPAGALASPAVIEGLAGFSGMLAGALTEVIAGLAAVPAPTPVMPNTSALLAQLQAGAFTAVRLKTE